MLFDGECYVVGFPFKQDAPDLVNNYDEAYCRLVATEKGQKRNLEKQIQKIENKPPEEEVTEEIAK